MSYVLDRYAMKLFKPVIDRAALEIKKKGYSADQVTFTGFGLGLFAALCIALGFYLFAILPLLASRALDGLDGAVARAGVATDRGAFLDIGLDFVFYASIPLAFGLANPDANALAAATLLAAFIGTCASFLAYAIIAEKRGLKSTEYPTKSFYYLGGLAEGTETIACFVAMCLWPQYFAALAYFYAILCLITTITRLLAGWHAFTEPKD
ncbi:MAG TPA: CDP-alcohol phosphatidyltransferase family protein [Aestuariivirga sp.]|jgi:phosphatidylglycerophosphate synthase|nr:CDP-alcohol phosphatidyltransferase family protein [Aestuariivirga sp.]